MRKSRPSRRLRENLKVSIRKSPQRLTIKTAQVREAIERTLTGEKRDSAEVSVLIVTDARIRELNRTYRGIDSSTDVLAFPMAEGKFAALNPDLIGDIVISAERARVQAQQAGHDLIDELRLLAAHGTLHLLGYEDETSRGRARMRRLAQKYAMSAEGRR
ncbi:MAG: rRNA maturation RNase YbeY [Candidatus Abyssobacteria bacterium SURF_5]|uniref:Endoribonuclease YbeY n=1 Tax=Abyssobacteria bacterium (strain SURF_5) TaxID=2093360 RepID=A0A3A4NUA2_ABYX5|nr:MAG: rRNA maturation RNase YbeY [Candidatus Abyssubacteria bacterium SURF_5]